VPLRLDAAQLALAAEPIGADQQRPLAVPQGTAVHAIATLSTRIHRLPPGIDDFGMVQSAPHRGNTGRFELGGIVKSLP
jgi:hypothetical protein